MNELLELSLRGSIAAGIVWLLDRALARTMAASGRRAWWALVPLAFLVSIPLPVLSPHAVTLLALWSRPSNAAAAMPPSTGTAPASFHIVSILFALWIAGVAIYLLVVALQTRTAIQKWSRLRLSTDPALLELLEDCKAEAGITAPIGLVVSDAIAMPAIMGWLRPRILLPEGTTAKLKRDQLRAVLLHELAHFRGLDVPLNWLFTLARAVHWFNPVVHFAARGWSIFREEAADEAALRTMGGASADDYGETLLVALRPAHGPAAPFGALAIGESIHHLKRRLLMINQYPNRSRRRFGAVLILVLLVAGIVVRPVRADDADPKQAAVAAIQTWLTEMDQGHYDQSWTDAAPSFQKAITSDKWVEVSNAVRAQLGKCTVRKLASSVEQTEVPSPTGTAKGDFVIAQYDSSFENLKYAMETVCFEKTADGAWKASGYYIKPRP